MKFLHFVTKFTIGTIICYDLLFPISSLADTKTQLLIKKNAMKGDLVEFPRLQIAEHTSYVHLLEDLPVVIDRSLFINFILDVRLGPKRRTDPFVVTAPSRWGKTIMLKMIDFFFSPELDENYKKVQITKTKAYEFFKTGNIAAMNGEKQEFGTLPLISSSKRLDTYIAQHPVVNLDFAHLYVRGDTLREVVENSFTIIRNIAIMKHIDVIQHLCTTKKNIDDEEIENVVLLSSNCRIFFQIYNKERSEVSKADVPDLFMKLLDLLHTFYKKEVVVLIDEYGSFLYDLCIPQEKSESIPSPNVRIPIKAYYESLLSSFTKNCQSWSPNLLLTIMTGIGPVAFSDLNTIDFYNFMDEDLYQFYGLEHEIATKLMRYAGFNDSTIIQHVVNFDHYEIPCKTGMTRFNPWSLLQTIYGTSKRYPWLSSTSQKFLKLVVEMNQEIRHTLQALVFGTCLQYYPPSDISFTTQKLLNIGHEAVGMNGNGVKNTFLQHLVQVGFLTVTREKEYEEKLKSLKKLENKLKKEEEDEVNVHEESICVKIPNLENIVLISEVLTNYNIRNENILGTSLMLAEMLNNHSISYDKFRENFELFLQRGGKNLINGSELYYHSLLLVKMVLPLETMHNYKYLVDYRLNRDTSTPDIILHNGTHGGIIKVEYNVASSIFDKAYDEQLPRYGTIFHYSFPNVKHLRLMLVHVKEKNLKSGRNLITVTMKERYLNTSIKFEELRKIYEANEKKRHYYV